MKSLRLLDRTMAILRCFTPEVPELSAAEIARQVGIPNTTAHRILINLTTHGILQRNDKRGNYRIGPELYLLGSLYLITTDILQAAEPVNKTLNELTGEAINLAIFQNGNIITIAKEESRHAFRYSSHIGSVLPAYASATGKAFLSELSDEEIDYLYPKEKLRSIAPKTVTTKAELKRNLEWIRKTGFSSTKEESYQGLLGIASLIRDASGKAVAGLSIAAPIFRVNKRNFKRLATLIKLGARLISYRLGYQDEINPVCSIEEIRFWWEQNQLDLVSQANSLTRTVPVKEL